MSGAEVVLKVIRVTGNNNSAINTPFYPPILKFVCQNPIYPTRAAVFIFFGSMS